MIFTFMAKTVLKKWLSTMSSRGFSTQLVSHETQTPLPVKAHKLPVDEQYCGNE